MSVDTDRVDLTCVDRARRSAGVAAYAVVARKDCIGSGDVTKSVNAIVFVFSAVRARERGAFTCGECKYGVACACVRASACTKVTAAGYDAKRVVVVGNFIQKGKNGRASA